MDQEGKPEIRVGELFGQRVLGLFRGSTADLDNQFEIMRDEPLSDHWQRINRLLGAQMLKHVASQARQQDYKVEGDLVHQMEIQSALTKSALLIKALRRGVTIEELMKNTMDDKQRASMLFSADEFFQIKAEAERYPDVPIGRAVLALELLVRGIYNQVQAGVTDRQAQAWFKVLYGRLRAKSDTGTSIYSKERAQSYTDQDRATEMLKNTLLKLREKNLIPANASILIVGPGDGIVEKAAIEPLLGDVIDTNIEIVGVDPESSHQPWDRMQLEQMTVQEYAKVAQGRQFDVTISWGSGPHNDYSLHNWITFFQALQKLGKPGSAILIEAGAIDESAGGLNKRLEMAKKFNQICPATIIGTYGPIVGHEAPGDAPDQIGVVMHPGLIYEAMVYLMEGKMLSQAGQKEIGDPNKDPVANPYYTATGPDDIRFVQVFQTGTEQDDQGLMLDLLEEAIRPFFAEEDQKEA
ncbi:MAG: hypothetical protein AUJ56_05455 [Zetaproteobacteria bacterium CG1_02_49_23]|nr:MAG: hypothetical protein AUJ56_05455 [Zetaproteobacteria bacterium CG1_02_49_23]